ncbi:hypothetical protein P170DRAFT_447674 [Aspergillus steynii IBT 23096]|uniref:Altered inheritance of mitochondria protein 9, mitochondrial n=1 Tax=Aspergillus steynii IBT 23096 TaxID=1392250 RepID=A0A2I2G4G6_9EURO|nr:uncharacterized protein P170DRAFT_447674 [Aspergillus steynii IBT 23096]PLB47775.1 hypothetical protein P170DRAFT_447674 [Aspergillus steynii IBT 23096]
MLKSPLFRLFHRPTRAGSTGGRCSFVNLTRTLRTTNDLFRYTSGRWLINDKHEQQQRFMNFNIDNLCSQAASLFSPETKCVHIAKFEGNFNKAFLLTMNDGNKVVAKIPCPNAGMLFLTTASDPENLVGAEYIIMEKVRGVALAERWETMNTLQRYKVIDGIVEMEKELEGMKLPAYGSLFLRDFLPSEYNHYPLPSDLDPTGLFCIGPSCSRAVPQKTSSSKSNAGPWSSILDFALSKSNRELALIADNRDGVQSHLNHFSEIQPVNEYYGLLQKVLLILPVLSHDPRILDGAASSIWHTDLHLGNIYVSSDDPTIIEGVIDWQSVQAAPLFIHAQFPEFIRPPKGYSPGTELPALPDNYDKLDPDQKEKANKEHTSATQSKYYEMSCLAYNKPVYDAMKLDRRLWEPFTCCQLFSNGSLVPLRSSLVRIFQDWELLGLPGSCPFEFTEEDLKRHDEQVQYYQDSVYLRDIVKAQLCTDDSGWIPNAQWESAREMNEHLYGIYMETLSEELLPEAASRRWPFPPKSA